MQQERGRVLREPYHLHNETYGIVKVMGPIEDCISPYCKEAVYRRDHPTEEPRCAHCGLVKGRHLIMQFIDRDFAGKDYLVCPDAFYKETRAEKIT